MKVVRNVLIPMRDGVRLAADLYVDPTADEGEAFPVVLEYIPYRKDDVAPGSQFYEELTRAGYVVARVDIRGTGGSEGVSLDEYTLEEQLDGVDTVEWLARQPFCDGQVNMMGISYGGFTALQVASHAPAHLRSVIPIDFTHDRYTDDCHYRGGLLRMYYDTGFYGNLMVALNALPPDPEWAGSDWARLWEEHLEGSEPYILEWLRHQTDGAYWRNGSVGDVAERIRCPVFMIGGWRDGYPNPPVELYQRLTVPRKLLVGPWNHAFPDVAVPGPRIDYLRAVVRWLDHWCRGRDTGIMDEPPVVIYLQHSEPPVVDRLDSAGEWRAEAEWPPPGCEQRALYLTEGGVLAESPGADGADAFEYDPTVGVCGGLWSGGVEFGLPGDQRPDEALSLVYTSPPLDEPLTVIGRARAFLHVSSTAPVMGFAVSFSDVAPDGNSHLIAKGMLNATRRRSLIDPEPLTAGEVVELDIPVDATAWRFTPGHRIRVAVASADFPNVWPTPEPGRNEVHRGANTPSRLVLPVVPLQGSATPPSFAPSPKEVTRFSAGIQPPSWEVTRDVLTGRTRVTIDLTETNRVNSSTVVRQELLMVNEVDPRDPAHANSRGRFLARVDRPGQRIEVRSDIAIQGTRSTFQVVIDLDLRLNEARHFARRWAESVPRQLL